jgi:hypothetical protein
MGCIYTRLFVVKTEGKEITCKAMQYYIMTWPGFEPGTSRKYNEHQSDKANRCDTFHHQVLLSLFPRCIYVRVFVVKTEITCIAKKNMTWPGFKPGTSHKYTIPAISKQCGCDSFHHQVFLPLFRRCIYTRLFVVKTEWEKRMDENEHDLTQTRTKNPHYKVAMHRQR